MWARPNLGFSALQPFTLSRSKIFVHSNKGTAKSTLKCEATPLHLAPLLEAAREKLRPLGLSVPSLTWRRPVLTVYVSRHDDDLEEIDDDGDIVNRAVSADDCADAAELINNLLDNREEQDQSGIVDGNSEGERSVLPLFDEQSYTLQVSSMGTSESLRSQRDFNAFRGFPVRVSCAPKRQKNKKGKTAESLPGENSKSDDVDSSITSKVDESARIVLGRLGPATGEHLTINIKGRPVKIARDDLYDVTLVTAAEIGEKDE